AESITPFLCSPRPRSAGACCLLTAAVAVLWLAAGPVARAQREPHIGYVYPAGGQQGTISEVLIGGQYLNGVSAVQISGAGLRALVLAHDRPPTPKQAAELRERMKVLRQERKTPAVIQEMAAIARKLAAIQKRRTNPVLADTVPVEITIARDATPGRRELRLLSPAGLSNPLVFQVGDRPEFREPELGAVPDIEYLKQLRKARSRNPAPAPTNTPSMAITIPAAVNGQILPGDVDRYRFAARRGQRLVVAASARALIPYLADAVPGWFQATLALYDAEGNELVYDDDYRFHPDPVLFYTVPQDGEYQIEIRDALYRGREDFVYRVVVGEVPFLAGMFPLGGTVGDHPAVEVRGWNLPLSRITLALSQTEPGIYPVYVRTKGASANYLPFALDTLPETLEQEPNNSPTVPERVTLPIIINGRSNQPGDADVFAFEGRAGNQVVAEVRARRLDSPLDSVLKLTAADGTQLAFNDDHDDKGSGLTTHHADSYLTATLPADGTYHLHLWDAQRQGGWAHAYRLRISPPRPDFELRVVPSSLNARPGASVPVTVYALRHDGFAGEIALALRDPPVDIKLNGPLLPAGQDQVKLTITAPSAAPATPVNLHLEGCATIDGREVRRAAVPADDLMQAFIYRHLVPAQELKLAVRGRPRPAIAARILSPTPLKIVAGGTGRLRVSLPARFRAGKIDFELSEPPAGINLESVSSVPGGTELVLETDAATVKPGLKGNLIVKIFAERPPPPGKEPPGNRRRIPLGALPAVPFEIVAP
ncbi:pre-peptidase C-terminal domain-containing protein, partial [bacterium]|nr:pre-peptidase C-terminal domain-containing protein [bacterium]